MQYVRASLRMIGFVLGTLGWYAAFLLGVAAGRAGWQWRCRIFRGWGRMMLRILGARVRVDGVAPPAGALLACNHLSYVDIALLAAYLDATFVAKLAVRGWPVLGRICQDMGTIFLDRANVLDVARVTDLIERELSQQHTVIVFPEGTSSPGIEVLPFHAPLLAPAQRLGISIHAAALTYRTTGKAPPAHLSVAWWGSMEFFSHLWHLFQLPGFDAAISFADCAIRCENRKQLARALHAQVAARFVPLVSREDFECTTPIELLTTTSSSSGKAWT